MLIKTISVLATASLVVVFSCLFVRGGLVGNGPVSIGLQVGALVLLLWARFTFGMRSFHFAANTTVGPLVTEGPYHYTRNPIYAAILLITWPGAAVHWSAANVGLALTVTALVLVRIFCEEYFLNRAYSEYAEYARSTARLLPFIF